MSLQCTEFIKQPRVSTWKTELNANITEDRVWPTSSKNGDNCVKVADRLAGGGDQHRDAQVVMVRMEPPEEV